MPTLFNSSYEEVPFLIASIDQLDSYHICVLQNRDLFSHLLTIISSSSVSYLPRFSYLLLALSSTLIQILPPLRFKWLHYCNQLVFFTRILSLSYYPFILNFYKSNKQIIYKALPLKRFILKIHLLTLAALFIFSFLTSSVPDIFIFFLFFRRSVHLATAGATYIYYFSPNFFHDFSISVNRDLFSVSSSAIDSLYLSYRPQYSELVPEEPHILFLTSLII